jgi:hypothetical protein
MMMYPDATSILPFHDILPMSINRDYQVDSKDVKGSNRSSGALSDGGFRKIEVRVKDKGLKVIHRAGYIAD